MVTPDAELVDPDGTIRVPAISSVVLNPLPPDLVPLPWKLPFHPVTRLFKPSVAVCGWIVAIDVSRVVAQQGKVPTKVMLRIARVLLSLDGRRDEP